VPFLGISPSSGGPAPRCRAQVILTNTLWTLADLLRNLLPHRTKLDSLGLLSALAGTAQRVPDVTSLVQSAHHGGFAIRDGDWKLLTFRCGGAATRAQAPGDPLRGTGVMAWGQLYNSTTRANAGSVMPRNGTVSRR